MLAHRSSFGNRIRLNAALANQGVAIQYIQPGKPDQNAYIERFNRTYRTEVLNAHLFESVAELRAPTETWLRIYNSERPHESLGRGAGSQAYNYNRQFVSMGTVRLTGKLTKGRRYRTKPSFIDALFAVSLSFSCARFLVRRYRRVAKAKTTASTVPTTHVTNGAVTMSSIARKNPKRIAHPRASHLIDALGRMEGPASSRAGVPEPFPSSADLGLRMPISRLSTVCNYCFIDSDGRAPVVAVILTRSRDDRC